MDDRFFVASLPTTTHLSPLYIALGEKRPGPSNWYLTDDPALAYAFTQRHDAAEAVEELRGNGDTDPMLRTFHLEDTARLWHVTSSVPTSRA